MSLPSIAAAPSFSMPASDAIRDAVAARFPVSITTRTPALRQAAMAGGTSARSGSAKQTRPISVSPSYRSAAASRSIFIASPNVRKPSPATRSACRFAATASATPVCTMSASACPRRIPASAVPAASIAVSRINVRPNRSRRTSRGEACACAVSVQRETARASGQGHHVPVNLRRRGAIEAQFGRDHGCALRHGAENHVIIYDRAFQLRGRVAGNKHLCAVGFDTFDRRALGNDRYQFRANARGRDPSGRRRTGSRLTGAVIRTGHRAGLPGSAYGEGRARPRRSDRWPGMNAR